MSSDFDLGFVLPDQPDEDDIRASLEDVRTTLEQFQELLEGSLSKSIQEAASLLDKLGADSLEGPVTGITDIGGFETKLRRKLATRLAVSAEQPVQLLTRLIQQVNHGLVLESLSSEQRAKLAEVTAVIPAADPQVGGDVNMPRLSAEIFGGGEIEQEATERTEREESREPIGIVDPGTGGGVIGDEGALHPPALPPSFPPPGGDDDIAIGDPLFPPPPGETTPPLPPPGTPPVTPLPPVLPEPGQPGEPPQQPGQPPDDEQPQPPTCPPQQPTCPAPIVQVVGVPCPPSIILPDDPDQQPEPDDGQITPLPTAPPGPPENQYCDPRTYEIVNEVNPVPPGLNQQGPITDLFFGRRFDLPGWIQGKKRAAARTRLIFANIVPSLQVWWGTFVLRWDQFVLMVAGAPGCKNPIFIGTQVWRGVLGFLGIFLGPAVAKFDRILAYRGDSFCPVEFPDEQEALNAFFRGTIDESLLKLWVEQNNHCWEPYKFVVDAAMNKIEPLFAIQAWRRKLLTDDEFKGQVRKAGITDEKMVTMFEQMAIFIPPVTDLVRFMVRDVEDPAIVDRFGLDDSFDAKWQAQIKEWGEFQGIEPDVAKRYWRAHWRLPSPTQLFDMFHRSRGKKKDDPLFTSREMVKTALEQGDLLPFWVDRMIDTTFRRLSRVDARRAFETGALTEAQLREQFTIIGYTDESVDALVLWASINKTRIVGKLPEVRLFRDGLTTRDRAAERLRQTLLTPDDINRVLDIAELQGRKPEIRRCINALRKRFLSGELDEAEIRRRLKGLGLPPRRISTIMEALECEAESKGKEFSAAQLCKFLDLGVLTPEEFLQRLQKVGWTEPDAMRILIECRSRLGEKAARQAAAAARREAAAIAKDEREREKLARRIKRSQDTAEKNLAKAERAQANRERLLQKAAARLAQKLEIGIEFAADCIQGVWQVLTTDTVLTTSERVQTIVLTVEKTKPTSCEDFRRMAILLGEALERFEELTDEIIERALEGVS